MSDLFDRLQADLTAARKAQDKPVTLVLGTILADVKNRRIELSILTSAQSRAVAGMFGAPAAGAPAGKALVGTASAGATVSLPDAAALETLRGQLPTSP